MQQGRSQTVIELTVKLVVLGCTAPRVIAASCAQWTVSTRRMAASALHASQDRSLDLIARVAWTVGLDMLVLTAYVHDVRLAHLRLQAGMHVSTVRQERQELAVPVSRVVLALSRILDGVHVLSAAVARLGPVGLASAALTVTSLTRTV